MWFVLVSLISYRWLSDVSLSSHGRMSCCTMNAIVEEHRRARRGVCCSATFSEDSSTPSEPASPNFSGAVRFVQQELLSSLANTNETTEAVFVWESRWNSWKDAHDKRTDWSALCSVRIPNPHHLHSSKKGRPTLRLTEDNHNDYTSRFKTRL